MLDLVRRVAKVDGEDCGADPAEWFRAKYGEEPDYSKLLDVLAPTPELRQQLLRGYFEPSPEELEQGLKQPTKAHRAIARLVADGFVRVILTTNFDRLTERAIEDAGVTPVVVSTHHGLAGCLPLVHQPCTVIKLHGDYLDTRVKNTPAELATYEAEIDRVLDRVFDEYGLIIAGWSGDWDTALRAAMERCPTRRFGFFWTMRAEPRDSEKQLLTARGGSSIRIADADTFFDDFATKVSLLDEVNTEHPASVSTAVALVKRYAARSEHRIRLHDLLVREADAVFAESDALLVMWQSGRGKDAQDTFLTRLLNSTSKLRQMMAHAAYWGGEEILATAIKCVAKLSQDPLPTGIGGTVRHDWFRAYLGGVVLYAAGVGFVTAGNYVAAARLLSEAYIEGFDRREPFLAYFTHHLEEVRRAMNMSQPRSTYVPFSDSMLASLTPELAELSSGPTDFETSFDEWELLAAFIDGGLENRNPENCWLTHGRWIYQWIHGRSRSGLFPPSPMRSSGVDTLTMCKAQRPFTELIAAGFFNSSWDRVLELRAMLAKISADNRFAR